MFAYAVVGVVSTTIAMLFAAYFRDEAHFERDQSKFWKERVDFWVESRDKWRDAALIADEKLAKCQQRKARK
jgi:hypothetical protein